MEDKLTKYREKLRDKEKTENIHPPSLTVNKIVYAGTIITIKESLFEVKEDIPGKVKFYLDDNNQATYK